MNKPMHIRLLPWLGLLLLVGGCSWGSAPPLTIKQWMLEYPPPARTSSPPLEARLKLARFSSARACLGTEMVYRQEDFERGVYPYNRWRVFPSDMVGDLLLRDLRRSGLFKEVLSHRQRESVRFRLEGSVERFLEVDGPQGPRAELALSITLLDTGQKDSTKRVLFQRDYQAKAAMKEKKALEQAAALSRALARLSRRIRADVRRAVEQALSGPEPEEPR